MEQRRNSRFAIVGVGGYIAPRHLGAVRSVGGSVVSACDVSDSVGIIDSYFPDAEFTTDSDAFFGSLGRDVADYLTVCTPNYLHCRHSLRGLEAGMDVICEKPVVLTVAEHRRLTEMQRVSGRRVYPVLQMRLHPEAVRIREKVESDRVGVCHDVELVYVAPRGRWYGASWKGDPRKSGGVLTNIGIHFVDLLHWMFGRRTGLRLHRSDAGCISGVLELERARVCFFLSVDPGHVPAGHTGACRRLSVDGDLFDFSTGFADLHDRSYHEIMAGRGFSLEDTLEAVATVEAARTTGLSPLTGLYHPMLKNFCCESGSKSPAGRGLPDKHSAL